MGLIESTGDVEDAFQKLRVRERVLHRVVGGVWVVHVARVDACKDELHLIERHLRPIEPARVKALVIIGPADARRAALAAPLARRRVLQVVALAVRVVSGGKDLLTDDANVVAKAEPR